MKNKKKEMKNIFREFFLFILFEAIKNFCCKVQLKVNFDPFDHPLSHRVFLKKMLKNSSRKSVCNMRRGH